MRREDVVIGMKVVPHSKTGICRTSFINYSRGEYSLPSEALKENGFLFVTAIKENGNFLLNGNLSKSGDFFLAEDFEPYVEPSVVEEIDESDELDESDEFIIPKPVPIKTMSLIDKSELIRLQEIEKKYKELTELLLKNAMNSLALYERLKV